MNALAWTIVVFIIVVICIYLAAEFMVRRAEKERKKDEDVIVKFRSLRAMADSKGWKYVNSLGGIAVFINRPPEEGINRIYVTPGREFIPFAEQVKYIDELHKKYNVKKDNIEEEKEKKPMSYHEEKLFVLKKFGYHCPDFSSSTTWWMPHSGEFDRSVAIDSYKWDPKFDRRCWDLIWDKMMSYDTGDGKENTLIETYIENLPEYCDFPDDCWHFELFNIQGTKPKICWGALIEALTINFKEYTPEEMLAYIKEHK